MSTNDQRGSLGYIRWTLSMGQTLTRVHLKSTNHHDKMTHSKDHTPRAPVLSVLE